MSTILHLGVRPDRVGDVERILTAYPEHFREVRVGDGRWGGVDSGSDADDIPLHLQAEIPDGSRVNLPLVLHALHSLDHLGADDNGVMATTTATQDHSDGIINWRLDTATGTFTPWFY